MSIIEEPHIYSSNSKSNLGLINNYLYLLRHGIEYQELIWQLFKRDFFMVYKKSIFGVFWLIISPLLGMTSWLFMNYTGILNPGKTQIPYPAYILLSTSLWGLFISIYEYTSQTLNTGSSYILQVNFPHDILFIKQFILAIANFLINFSIVLIILLIFGITPNILIFLMPIFCLPIFFLSSALGLTVSIISVVTIDMQKFVAFFLGVLMFFTPIIYSADNQNSLLQKVVIWNPLSYLIGGIRDIIITGNINNIEIYIGITILSFIMFLLSWHLFFVSEQKVIEKML